MSIQVTLIPSQRAFTVERDEPILAAAIRQGRSEEHTSELQSH